MASLVTACGWAFGLSLRRFVGVTGGCCVRGKGTKQFLAVRHRATHRIPLCCPILQTFPARHRIDCWTKGVRMEALQSSSLIKRDSIVCCVGGRAGFTA